MRRDADREMKLQHCQLPSTHVEQGERDELRERGLRIAAVSLFLSPRLSFKASCFVFVHCRPCLCVLDSRAFICARRSLFVLLV